MHFMYLFSLPKTLLQKAVESEALQQTADDLICLDFDFWGCCLGFLVGFLFVFVFVCWFCLVFFFLLFFFPFQSINQFQII